MLPCPCLGPRQFVLKLLQCTFLHKLVSILTSNDDTITRFCSATHVPYLLITELILFAGLAIYIAVGPP